LAGILFTALYRQYTYARFRGMCVGFLMAVVFGNMAYVWLKKEPQFVSRAAPTRELLTTLNDSAFSTVDGAIFVCDFPLHASIGRAAVEGFTALGSGKVAFPDRCDDFQTVNAVDWTPDEETYLRRVSSALYD
jgi:hypothetical protein